MGISGDYHPPTYIGGIMELSGNIAVFTKPCVIWVWKPVREADHATGTAILEYDFPCPEIIIDLMIS